MSIRKINDIKPYTLIQDNYQLDFKYFENYAQIFMYLHVPILNTAELPLTYNFLQSKLPKVLDTKCFNDLSLPFNVEVKNTETGHLFEHILLEYLCKQKIKSGHGKAYFRGITTWDWQKYQKGTYEIKIYLSRRDIFFFDIALKNTIDLFNKIISNTNYLKQD